MAWTKMTESSKTVDSPVTYDTTNGLITDAKDSYDAFTARHTTAGEHDDDLLPKGRGRITYSGTTPSLAQSWGIVSTVVGITGGVRVTISPPSTNTTGIHVSIMDTGGTDLNAVPRIENLTTATFDLFFENTGDTTREYPASFTFAVWTD